MPKLVVIGQDLGLSRSVAALTADTLHVLSASSARSGINACCAVEPACIVIEHDPPEIDGIAIARALRQQPTAVATSPMVMLLPSSATALRTEALAEGVDVCLVRPVRPVDVLGQCRALMAMAGRIAGATSSRRLPGEGAPSTNRPRALVGSLDRMPPTTVLAVLELEQRSGELVLSGVSGTKTRLVLELASGALLGGRVGNLSMGAVDAMREALRWQGRRFEFVPGEPRPGPADAHKVGTLLIAAMRSEPEGDLSELNSPPPSLQPAVDQRAIGSGTPPPPSAPAPMRGSGVAFRAPVSRRRSQPPPRRSTLMSQQAVTVGAATKPATVPRRLSEQVRAAIRVEQPLSHAIPAATGPHSIRDPRAEPEDDDVLEAENLAPPPTRGAT